MRKNNKNIFSVDKRGLISLSVAVFMFTILLSVSLAAAQGQPKIPYSLYGAATLNGNPLPAGSVITAVINGEEKGIYTTVIDGQYGGPLLNDGKLYIMEGDNTNIDFYVESPTMHSKVEAIQTAVWKSGEIEELKLDFSGEDVVSYFYGLAKINDDENAPVNSVITAETDGVVKGSITVREEGRYGSESGNKLSVFDALNDDEIRFYIKLPDSDKKVEATEKGKWSLGETTELDLNFIGEETDADPVCSFYGSVIFDNTNAPAGSVITAEINNVIKGSVTVQEEGKYGSEEDGKLDVYNGEDGDTVEFFIKVPGYSKRIESGITATWIDGRIRILNLVFSSPAEDDDTTDSDSNDNNNDNPVVNTQQGTDNTNTDNELSSESTKTKSDDGDETSEDENGNEKIEMRTGDERTFNVNGKDYIIKVKSTSDFGVLISIDDENNMVIGKGETEELDLDGDGETDLTVTLEDISSGVATLTFIKPEKSDSNESPITGMITSGIGGDNMVIAGIGILIAAVVIGGIFTYKKRGRRSHERGYKSFSF